MTETAPVLPKPQIRAHRHSQYHREEIEASETCGCFYCLEIFAPSTITRWTDKDTTAICPKCGIDSVIGNESQYPITVEFLTLMRDSWFS